MQISPIINNNIQKTTFTSTTRTTYFDKQLGSYALNSYDPFCYNMQDRADYTYLVSSNMTYFLRKDMPWETLPDILDKRYPNQKVNIYNFACSDGSEAYSLALSLIDRLGEEKASRFFPIIASDIDKEIIDIAKKGKLYGNTGDLKKLSDFIKKPKEICDYFEIEKLTEAEKAEEGIEFDFIIRPKEILSKNIQFKEEDIEEGLDKIEKNNSFVLARNFWRYLGPEKLADTMYKLRKNTNETSLIAIGNFDKTDSEMTKYLGYLGIEKLFDCRDNPLSNIMQVRKYHKLYFDEKYWKKNFIKNYGENFELSYSFTQLRHLLS